MLKGCRTTDSRPKPSLDAALHQVPTPLTDNESVAGVVCVAAASSMTAWHLSIVQKGVNVQQHANQPNLFKPLVSITALRRSPRALP
jgi:hypothetical protein